MSCPETLSSRQNAVIKSFRALGSDAHLRSSEALFLCDGDKLLEEALRSGAEIQAVLWKDRRNDSFGEFPEEYVLKPELFDYVSPLKNSPGPLFSVRLRELRPETSPDNVLVLEGVQDPGNVGTVIRTADAFGIGAVILLEGCADAWAPKTVRAGMGAAFRQPVLRMSREALPAYCREHGLRLCGAALSERAEDLRSISLAHTAVAVGSEGRGLSPELLALCETELIIPMRGEAESLNAAVAASILMWEMQRRS